MSAPTASPRPPVAVARALLGLIVLGLALGGCITAEVVQEQPQGADDGLQATGEIEGASMAISDGGPTVTLGDCDPRGAADEDLCMVARSINGEQVNLVIENPAVLEAGTTVPIEADPCTTCDEVTGHAVVELRLGTRDLPATGGRLQVTAAGERYAADFELRLAGGGQLTGTFDVEPLSRPGAPAPVPIPSPQLSPSPSPSPSPGTS